MDTIVKSIDAYKHDFLMIKEYIDIPSFISTPLYGL